MRSPRNITSIAKALNTTPEYLLGETDDPSPSSLGDSRLAFHGAPAAAPALPDNAILIPQLQIGYSMCGGSVFDVYQQTAMVPFPRPWLAPLIGGSFADLLVARGRGDSMLPTLLDGDLVIVDTAQKRIEDQDRLWCLSYGDLDMIKRCRVPGRARKRAPAARRATFLDIARNAVEVASGHLLLARPRASFRGVSVPLLYRSI